MILEKLGFEFVTALSFESSAKKLLSEEDRRQLELLLLRDPEAGR